MNHGTQNSGSQDFENQLLMSSNVWYTDEGQSQQLPFLPFTPAETQVQGVAVATPPLQAENEVFVNEQYFALPPLTNPTPGVVQDEADYNYWIGNLGTADEQISRGAEAPLWEVETNHQFHQAVTSPAAVPQAEDGLWALEPPPLDDDLYPLIVSPADDFAPIFTEPTSQVAAPAPAFTAAQATSVGAAVEANQEEAEAQVEEEADADIGSSTQAMKSYREHHNECERRRRDKISDRIDQLRELVPGCKKTDRGSVLEETCRYLKSLQNQVNMLRNRGTGTVTSTGTGVSMNLATVHFHVPVPVCTLQIPANTAANLPPVANYNMHGQHCCCFYHTGYYHQAENNAIILHPHPVAIPKWN